MPDTPSAADLELAFYERFFFSRGLEPYPVQERALDHIFAGHDVLVTVPTGTGKTLIAKAAISKALGSGQTAIYTTPLRALTEEKYRELCDDFGEERVGFATGDYKVRPEAPVQVVVAEILWNKIYGGRVGGRASAPADVVILDEGHYFNDAERGYVWEQSIIGLDARSQLVILSATVGMPQQFCNWVWQCRRSELHLVESHERRVPLRHVWRESYLIEVAKELFQAGDVPAIVFTFGREQCFERARLLKSCPRFVTDEERAQIARACDEALLDRGVAKTLRPLLLHGIGVHHAGILPRYKQLVERLTLERLLKFVVSTETISAGINLPAHTVVFPSLRKYVQKKARLLSAAEYHQMAGRAGRPQFDTEGLAVSLAPEEVVAELRRELREAAKGRRAVGAIDEAKARKNVWARARSQAAQAEDVIWDAEDHARIVAGQPAVLHSHTRITAEQVLAIGLPDLAAERASEAAPQEPGAAGDEGALPASLHLDIRSVIDHLLLDPRERLEARQRLQQVIDNLRALGVVDEHGVQVSGQVINALRGIDGLFVYDCLMSRDLEYAECRELVEMLVDHDVVQRVLDRKTNEERRAWIKARLRERRQNEPQVSWEDVEAEYEQKHPRELTPVEQLHAAFLQKLPHPELHGGLKRKTVFAQMEDGETSFMDFVERENLQTEEGNLFSYLIRVMKFARMLVEATGMDDFARIEETARRILSAVDERVAEENQRV